MCKGQLPEPDTGDRRWALPSPPPAAPPRPQEAPTSSITSSSTSSSTSPAKSSGCCVRSWLSRSASCAAAGIGRCGRVLQGPYQPYVLWPDPLSTHLVHNQHSCRQPLLHALRAQQANRLLQSCASRRARPHLQYARDLRHALLLPRLRHRQLGQVRQELAEPGVLRCRMRRGSSGGEMQGRRCTKAAASTSHGYQSSSVPAGCGKPVPFAPAAQCRSRHHNPSPPPPTAMMSASVGRAAGGMLKMRRSSATQSALTSLGSLVSAASTSAGASSWIFFSL